MERKSIDLKEITSPDNIMKVIGTTTSLKNIQDLQEVLKPFGIQLSVYEEEFPWTDAVKILVFVIPAKERS